MLPPDLQSIFDRLWAAEIKARHEAVAEYVPAMKAELAGRGILRSSITVERFKNRFREELRGRCQRLLSTIKRVLDEARFKLTPDTTSALRADLAKSVDEQTLELAGLLAKELSSLSLGGGDLAVQDEAVTAKDTLLAEFDLYVKARANTGPQPISPALPTGWPKVDRQIGEVRLRLEDATSEEQFQAVGLLCREVLISVAQAIYDPAVHQSPDGVVPSDTDAKRQLEAVFNHELSGSSNAQGRAHARAAVDLATALQHKRTADARAAALCTEATLSVVNIAAILRGRR